ncbi:C69 family dipeptidase [bacterium]|nr:C69 family dipeptidase [bacterium]
MKRFIIITILIAILSNNTAWACSSIVAGKKATKNGAVLFGHNEDDYGQRVVNAWFVPRIKYESGSFVNLHRGGKLEQVAETWAFTWFQTNDLEFSDYYANEWHVHIGSNACRSREDNPELTDGGIGYMLRRLVAERATTAREGIEIAGALLDRFGYASSGRTYIIADPREAWLLSVVEGKHWVASRVPDNQVVFQPNQYIIRGVDFSDTQNFISSGKNIRDYAIERGWYDSASGEDFDFARAYTYIHRKDSKYMKRGFDTRQWAAQRLITGTSVSIHKAKKEGLPFSVKPNRKLAVTDIQAVLRHHFEGTVYGPAYEVSAILPPTMHAGEKRGEAVPVKIKTNPNNTSERTISTLTTVFSTVAELRDNQPDLLKTVLWTSSGRPDCNAYIPWYTATECIPHGYNNTPGIKDPVIALRHHFDPVPGTFDYDSEAAWWAFNELENLVDRHFARMISIVYPVWQEKELVLFKMQAAIESTVKTLLKNDADLAKNYLCDYMAGWAASTVKKTRELNHMMKSQFYH